MLFIDVKKSLKSVTKKYNLEVVDVYRVSI